MAKGRGNVNDVETVNNTKRELPTRLMAAMSAGSSRVASAMGNHRIVWTVVDATRLHVFLRNRGRAGSRDRLFGENCTEYGCVGRHYNVRQNITRARIHNPLDPRGDVQDRWTSKTIYVGPAFKGGRRQVSAAVRLSS